MRLHRRLLVYHVIFRHVVVIFYVSNFSFTHTPTTEIYTLSLHDALPISAGADGARSPPWKPGWRSLGSPKVRRSEEHTSELQSHSDLVCRLLLEKKKTDALFACSPMTSFSGSLASIYRTTCRADATFSTR